MAGFNSIKDIVDAEINGNWKFSTWRKSPTQVTTRYIWFDLSMSPGNPTPQYYAASPLISVQMKQSTDGGLYHSGNVSPNYKFLRKTMALATASTALPMQMMLLDYLLYYPFIDEGSTDEQMMINTYTLPRYTDGDGVQIMAVSVAGRTGGQSFIVSYTNQDGISGRTSQIVKQNTATATGHIVTSNPNTLNCNSPFIPLQIGDTGVRSIESVTMLGADVGLFTLVLVKPIASTMIVGVDAPVEKDYFLESATLPKIEDDAYLNFICLPNGALNATAIHGYIETIWN